MVVLVVVVVYVVVFWVVSKRDFLVRFIRSNGVFENIFVARRGGEEEVSVHDV